MSSRMMPVLVAVVGESGKGPGFCRTVGERLRKRGLRVQVVRGAKEPVLSEDVDVVLIGCADGERESVAEQIERFWTGGWIRWYAAIRPGRRGAPCLKS